MSVFIYFVSGGTCFEDLPFNNFFFNRRLGVHGNLDKTDRLVFNAVMNGNHGKKKQPQVVRAQLLESAAQIAVERGLGSLTLDLVAQKAGISKGGLIHHFPSRIALIEGLFDRLLFVFEKSIEEFISCDKNESGKFTRAYIKATANSCDDDRKSKLLGAFALAMSNDEALSAKWRDWLQKQIEKYGEDKNPVLGSVIRYAADGIWLEDCTGARVIDDAERKSVVDYLIELTYTI
jgi:AcrR family transcriptional regulator